ncbi:MAG: presqualene diphosphate synthase HpnD [Pseudomonadota bacterium]
MTQPANIPETDFEARDHVHRVVEASGTSFLAGMKALPEERREAMFAIYAFCREIDDIADDPAPPSEKIARLSSWRKEIDRLYDGRPEFLTARALARPIAAYKLEQRDFLDLIDGMEMDAVEDIQAPTMSTLDTYCDRVASAVGRLSVRAFGATEDRSRQVAYYLGRALQLTNILRDLQEDAERGRLYLPAELLDAHNIKTRVPLEVLAHPNLPGVCDDLIKIARDHYTQAAAAMRKCRRGPMRPARLMMAAYRAILARLQKRGWHELDKEVSLPTWRKVVILLRHGLF